MIETRPIDGGKHMYQGERICILLTPVILTDDSHSMAASPDIKEGLKTSPSSLLLIQKQSLLLRKLIPHSRGPPCYVLALDVRVVVRIWRALFRVIEQVPVPPAPPCVSLLHVLITGCWVLHALPPDLVDVGP